MVCVHVHALRTCACWRVDGQTGPAPVASLVVAAARDEALEGGRLLRVFGRGAAALHIAKLALEGPCLNQLLHLTTQHLPCTAALNLWR